MAAFTRRGLAAMLDEARRGAGPGQVAGRTTGRAEFVPLPPLAAGASMFARLPVTNEPPDAAWDEPGYESVTPWICSFSDAIVHSDAGIVCLGDEVVAETLLQTNPGRNAYTGSADGIELAGSARPLAGSWLSLLAGNHGNYYHWTLDCLGRLAAADPAAFATTNLLLPRRTTEFHHAAVALLGLAASHHIRDVTPDETLHVEHLVVPWSVTGWHRPHPCIAPHFARLRAGAAQRDEPWPARLYIDRSGSDQRRLLNEPDLIAALTQRGFTPVQLERHTLADQIALFANASIIVAPHGAGLANILYATPGCCLLELQMDGWVNWCFRRLAAVCGLTYDCVLGRQRSDQAWVHARQWEVSPFHVLAAVERMDAASPYDRR